MPKRKRQSVSRSSIPRRVKSKKELSFPLLELPIEILDLILEEALYFPEIRQTSAVYSHCISDTLRSSILRANSFFRQKCLQMIRDEFAWIRIGNALPEIWYRILANDSFCESLVPDVWRHAFEHTVTTLDVFVGLSNPTATSDRILSSSKKSVFLPFSYRVWLEFLESIQRGFLDLDRPGVANLALRCYSLSPAMGRVIDKFIMPPLLNLRALDRIGFQGIISDHAARRETTYMTEGLGLGANLEDLREILGQILDLEEGGQKDDAGLLALFSYPRIVMCISCLPISYVRYPRLQASSENEDLLMYRNGIAQLYFHLEVKALRKYFDICLTQGIEWARLNHHLSDDGDRWTRCFMDLGFSLRHEHRRRLLMNIAAALDVEARIPVRVEVDEEDGKLLRRDKTYAIELAWAETFIDVASKMLGNEEVTNEFGSRIEADEGLLQPLSPQDRDQYAEFHNVQGTGFYWAGHKAMLERWGGETKLRNLPQTLKSLVVIDTRPKLANGELTPEVRYCGKECNCIIF